MPEPATGRAGRAGRGGRAGASEAEALQALQERLERATAAAERLLAQAAAEPGIPPRGWQRAGAGEDDGERPARPWAGWIDAGDAEVMLGLLAGVRELVPTELAQRLAAAVREVLLALRALIDWCLERAERRRAAPVAVQDIPIL